MTNKQFLKILSVFFNNILVRNYFVDRPQKTITAPELLEQNISLISEILWVKGYILFEIFLNLKRSRECVLKRAIKRERQKPREISRKREIYCK